MMNLDCSRGSEWRVWDLHIHTPASYHWNGKSFTGKATDPINYSLVDEMIHALNNAEPAVFCFMDYWNFDGWFALQNRLQMEEAPKLRKIVFPGIELRTAAPMQKRLNTHVIFSNKITKQELKDFLSDLKILIPHNNERNLSEEALIEFAKNVSTSKLEHHGKDIEKVHIDNKYALSVGYDIAELTTESYKLAMRKLSPDKAVAYLAFDTHGGLDKIDRNENFTFFFELFQNSPIFETRNQTLIDCFIGNKTSENESFFNNFQGSINNIPRLAVSGSDAHQFVGISNDNNKRGYGDFPSNKKTWIKADPTFEGLLQAIREPKQRSYIGAIPPKLDFIGNNKSYFLDSLTISKIESEEKQDNWLDGTELLLNQDLIAIIGNKGSGKSALADIIASVGGSKQKKYFSFLKKDRFRGRNGTPAKYFDATLNWTDQHSSSLNLNEDHADETVELVKYIPQNRFENLCNAHVTGDSDAFEKELRDVIFSHIDSSDRNGANDLDWDIERYRSDLKVINIQIEKIERDIDPGNKRALEEKLKRIEHEIEEHKKIKPDEISAPNEELNESQKELMQEVENIDKQILKYDEDLEENQRNIKKIGSKKQSLIELEAYLKNLQASYDSFLRDTQDIFQNLIGILKSDELIRFKYNENIYKTAKNKIENRIKDLELKKKEISNLKEKAISTKAKLNKQLAGPQQVYQEYLEKLKSWNIKYKELEGDETKGESKKGLEQRIKNFEELPTKLAELEEERLDISKNIFKSLDMKIKEREKLFLPAQEIITSNAFISKTHQLKFKTEIHNKFDEFHKKLFGDWLKQDTGDFRGTNSYQTLRGLIDKYEITTSEGIIGFIKELNTKLIETANTNEGSIGYGIASMLRARQESHYVYDYLYGLEFIELRYTILFQDTHIEQLSPGQRGSLLLIFYLLVNKEKTPIILDQPEENLDNETIINLLVPVLREAKKTRQVIMVTHNPNLAVVCDAEQIIHAHFDRQNGNKITYTMGSIESKEMNKKIVDVLEGTMPAFDNRRRKYSVD